jgi:hypothetical protein
MILDFAGILKNGECQLKNVSGAIYYIKYLTHKFKKPMICSLAGSDIVSKAYFQK